MRHKHSRSYFVISKNNSPNECVGLKALLGLSHYIIIQLLGRNPNTHIVFYMKLSFFAQTIA